MRGATRLIQKDTRSDMELPGDPEYVRVSGEGGRPRPARTAVLVVVFVVSLLLLSVAVALLVVAGVERTRGAREQALTAPSAEKHQSGHGVWSDNPREQLQQEEEEVKGKRSRTPRAMLTAPNAWNSSHSVKCSDSSGLDKPRNLLAWMDQIGNAFLHGGFGYSEGDLLVPSRGTYRLFLQLAYAIPSDRYPGRDLELFAQVLKFPEEYPKETTLLETREGLRVPEVPAAGVHVKTLYTSGMFELTRGTRLRVRATCSEHIVLVEQLTFFGAERLDD